MRKAFTPLQNELYREISRKYLGGQRRPNKTHKNRHRV